MAPRGSNGGVHSQMDKLSINASTQNQPPVVDSWDDGDTSSEEEQTGEAKRQPSHISNPSDSYPSAPPPTPMSPGFSNVHAFDNASLAFPMEGSRNSRENKSERRPEKTTQTASRMIAAGLGVKAPKRSEEQKQYDKATREHEAKRRNQQKEDQKRQEEEREKAKVAMWDG